eukprot:1376998-Amorphochlora_amoeboformis.AAC.1
MITNTTFALNAEIQRFQQEIKDFSSTITSEADETAKSLRSSLSKNKGEKFQTQIVFASDVRPRRTADRRATCDGFESERDPFSTGVEEEAGGQGV